MENLIEKLDNITDNITDNKKPFNSWSLVEIKQLLDIYFIISKKESHIFRLIYSYHGCDSWKDIFRDYNTIYLKDKADGIEIAIKELIEQIDKEKQK